MTRITKLDIYLSINYDETSEYSLWPREIYTHRRIRERYDFHFVLIHWWQRFLFCEAPNYLAIYIFFGSCINIHINIHEWKCLFYSTNIERTWQRAFEIRCNETAIQTKKKKINDDTNKRERNHNSVKYGKTLIRKIEDPRRDIKMQTKNKWITEFSSMSLDRANAYSHNCFFFLHSVSRLLKYSHSINKWKKKKKNWT